MQDALTAQQREWGRVMRNREFNQRLFTQYTQMLYMLWMGATFEGDALVRWRRLQALYQ